MRDTNLGVPSYLSELPPLAHPNLRFLASALPFDVQGESLFNQSLRAMADKGWIFKYGRVPITFVCQDYLADVTSLHPSFVHIQCSLFFLIQRAFAPPGNFLRCKLSVMAEACATMEELMPRSYFQPPEKHFFPAARNAKTISDFAVVSFVPKIHQVCIPRTPQGRNSHAGSLAAVRCSRSRLVGLCPPWDVHTED